VASKNNWGVVLVTLVGTQVLRRQTIRFSIINMQRSGASAHRGSSATAEGEGAGENVSVRSIAMSFWSAFARSNEEGCREALRTLGDCLGQDYASVEEVVSSPESLGKFVKVELPPTSPRTAQATWNSDKKTTLLRVDPQEHCLMLDGDAKQ
jgi:hypothetical protein